MEWVKIMCNILDHRKIKLLRKSPVGDTLVLLWLMMLAEAGKNGRGGSLLISDSTPYTGETLSMLMDISLSTVELGLAAFARLEMIDFEDGIISIRNWRKYQSEDRFEARREKDRLRQQRHRKNSHDVSLPQPEPESRDSVTLPSRDVTLENRQEQNRQEQNREEQSRKEQTTDSVRLLLQGTPLFCVSDQDLQNLKKRHGSERLHLAADIAVETWRRDHEDRHNPGGYLHSLCASLVVPDWYVPLAERQARAKATQQRQEAIAAEKVAITAQEEAASAKRVSLWNGLSEEEQEAFRSEALADMPVRVNSAAEVVLILAKQKAWEATQVGGST